MAKTMKKSKEILTYPFLVPFGFFAIHVAVLRKRVAGALRAAFNVCLCVCLYVRML